MSKLTNGRKQFIGMIAIGIIGMAWAQGWIDDKMFLTLESAAGTFLGVGVIHHNKKRDAV